MQQRGGPPQRKFLLVRVGAPPIELRPQQTFTVGRSNDCSLTVPSQRVSRVHAEITWQGGFPVLTDKGSQNGTLVNGKRIKGDRKLCDGDELEFGPYLCTYQVSGGSSVSSDAAPDPNTMTQPMVGDAMAGRLDQINLTELLQTLDFNQKTGTLEIFGGDEEGSIVVKNGAPTFAQASSKSGEEAIYDLVACKNGQFSFSPEITEEGRNVNKPMGSILMEACRRIDEG